MTTSRWNDEKLDRLADIVSGIATEVQGLSQKLEETANIANSNARVIQAIADTMAEAAEERLAAAEERRAAAAERQENLRLIIQQQSEIRGLQTENKRMWEMLLDQRNRDDNPNT